MFLRSSACDQNRQKLHFITVKKSDNVPADRCSSSFKTFFFSFFFFLSVHFVFCKRTQNVLSVALRWWTECDFCTEQLLEGLTNTAKWNAINLAYSTIAACLLCKGLYQSWLGIGEFFCPILAKWTPQISYWPTSDKLIVILFGNLCCPQSYFHSVLHLISRRKTPASNLPPRNDVKQKVLHV